jgi:hypothetical protein
LDNLSNEWEPIKAAMNLFDSFDKKEFLSSVQLPQEAYFRALQALDWLKKHFDGWQDFVEVF